MPSRLTKPTVGALPARKPTSRPVVAVLIVDTVGVSSIWLRPGLLRSGISRLQAESANAPAMPPSTSDSDLLCMIVSSDPRRDREPVGPARRIRGDVVVAADGLAAEVRDLG